MRKTTFFLFLPLLLLIGCARQTAPGKDTQLAERNSYIKQFCLDKKVGDTWYVYIDDNKESKTFGDYGWKNTANDKIMLPAQYIMVFEDCFDNKKMKGFPAASNGEKGIWYHKPNGEKIVQAYVFDNGPDYFEEGLARFIENGKIGFMDEALNKVIPAQFDGAFPFEEGKAKVCNGCALVSDDEHGILQGGSWWEINTKGDLQLIDEPKVKP